MCCSPGHPQDTVNGVIHEAILYLLLLVLVLASPIGVAEANAKAEKQRLIKSA